MGSVDPVHAQTQGAPFDDQMRQPWVPDATPPFLRSWLICGRFPNSPKAAGEDTLTTLRAGVDTDYLKNYADEGAAQPVAGTQEPLPGGGAVTWTPYASPIDTIDFTQIYTDHQTNNCVAYAYTTVTSPAPDDVLLTVGSDDSVRVWLNGKVVDTAVAARGVVPDADIVAVHLNRGANSILVKVVNAGGGWGFALRLAHPLDLGAALFRPWVDPETSGHKVEVDTAPAKNDAVPVDISIVAAGGRIVDRERSTLGAPVTFDASRWPTGAYEARCIPTFQDGTRSVVHLGFYHGDALAAARRLVGTAPANGQTQAELTHAMLADLIRSEVGDPAKDKALTADQVLSIVSPLMEWEEIEKHCQIHPYGFVRFAYRDPIDDSPQFCRAYLPPDYTPKKKWPMVVILHGANFDNPPYIGWAGTWGIDARHSDGADIYHVIELEPMGRYNAFYSGLGEQDVLRSIRMAREQLSVDDDRIYLGGISMGGAGTWGMGSRHPELFAAISPNLGVFDYHVGTPAADVERMSPRDLFFREAQSTLVGVESLLTTPIFVNHGDADPVINVNQSRYAIRMLQRWGYDVRYWEHPGGGHGDFNSDPQLYPWFLRHTLVRNPVKVRLRSADIKTASAHWLRILECGDPFELMTGEAEVTAPNRIQLSTANAIAVALSPKAPLIDPSRPVRVIWNGVEQRPAMLSGGVLTLYAAGYDPSTRDKNALIAGPLNDITNTPYAIVVGTTSPDPAVKTACQESAARLVRDWQRAQHCTPRVLTDSQVTDAQIARYSLFLIGGPDANAVTAKLIGELPLQVGQGHVTIAGRSFEVADPAYQAIFPNPRNRQRYVRVCGATSAAGMDRLWSIPDGAFDFGVVDAATGKPIAGGVFDAHWRCTDTGTLLGNDALVDWGGPFGRR